MRTKKTIAGLAATVSVGTLASVALAGSAWGHGSMQSPASRVYACFLEGPEAPKSAACKDAVATGGTQPLYDWNEVNIGSANGRHRELIPDGKLCSANRSKYAAFDVPRADWPATNLTSGARHDFRYKATAPHPGGFELFITRPGYDPTKPLRWADLESFASTARPSFSNGAYSIPATLPARSGRHLIYSIWQRTDSTEAFYTCSDVQFGGTTTPSPTTTTTATSSPTTTRTVPPSPTTTVPTKTVTSTTTPSPTATTTPNPPQPSDWAAGKTYATNAIVTYAGSRWICVQGHTAQVGWEPTKVPALWGILS